MAQITASELKNTKAGDGRYISMTFTVSGPTHSGRKVFGNINIKNRNPEAERIGLQQLGQLLGSIGVVSLTDTDQLIGHLLSIKVGTSKPQAGYDPRNEVKGYKAIEGSVPPAPSVPSKPVAGSVPPRPF